jgi:hypothetical protein
VRALTAYSIPFLIRVALSLRMLDAVIRETKMTGLRINVAKTIAAIWLPILEQLRRVLQSSTWMKYLGFYVRPVNRDIDDRCKVSFRAYGRLMPLRLQTKLRVLKTRVDHELRQHRTGVVHAVCYGASVAT